MPTPTWNQIAAPNFSAGNDLIAQAMNQLSKATTGFKSIADQYKDTIQKRNLGLIQEYVNSAKTPEELQSEAFQTGLANLTKPMGGEYDTLAKAQLVDAATDKLTTRALNNLNLERGQFGFGEEQQAAKRRDFTAKLYSLRDKPLEYAALEAQGAANGLLDPKASQDIQVGIENLKSGRRANEIGDATKAATIESTNLDPKVKKQNMANSQEQVNIAWYNALTQRAQAEAAAEKARQEKENTKNGYIATGMAAIDTATKDINKQIYGSGLNTDPTKSWKKWHEEATKGIGLFGGKADAAPNTLVKLIDNHPVLKKLPDNLKILHAENALREVRDSEWLTNPIGFTSSSEDALYKKALERSYADFQQQATKLKDNATIPLYRKMVFEHAQKTGANGYAAAKDLGLDELTIYKSGIASPLASQAKLKYAGSDKSIPEDQFIENEINIATDPNYAAQNAPLFSDDAERRIKNTPVKDSKEANSSTDSRRGFGLHLGGEMVVTQNPVSTQTQFGLSNGKITAAYLDNLVKNAKKANPNLDGIKFIQGLNIDPEIKRKYLDGEL